MFRFGTAFRGTVDKGERIQSNENDQKSKGKDRRTWSCLAEKIKEESGGNLLPKNKRFKKEDIGQEILRLNCSRDIYVRF